MKVDIGIIGAMQQEVEGIVAVLKDTQTEEVSGITFFVGTYAGKRVAVARCGVGKVFAAICAEAMIIKYSPSLLINTGVGGGIGEGVATGDVVIADKLVQYDMDTSELGDRRGMISGINKIYFDADGRAVDILCDAAEEYGINAYVGGVATGDRFVSSPALRQQIVNEFSALACEMEGAAIAHTAFVNGVPFAVIRAISDNADGNATIDFPTFMPIAAERSAKLALALVEKY